MAYDSVFGHKGTPGTFRASTYDSVFGHKGTPGTFRASTYG